MASKIQLLSDGLGRVDFAVPDITDADVDAVSRVLKSGWLTSGSECIALEEELSGYLGVDHVVAVASGTAALELAYASLGLPEGARVGVPTWTFVASAFAAVHYGGVPILLDSDPATLNVSVDAVEAALDSGLDALVAVHFAGTPVGRAVHERCREHGVPIIEDAAHAFGASDHRGRLDGSGSVGAAFSFYATKNLTCGEGGALATDSPERAAFARAYRLHGLTRRAGEKWAPDDPDDIIGPGIKANLSDVLAALARSQLTRFDDQQARRRVVVGRYRANLGPIGSVGFVPDPADRGSADHLMVIRMADRTVRRQVFDALAAAGITSGLHFRPLHHQTWFQKHAEVGPGGTAVADEMADRLLSLPLHPGLSDHDVDRVCEVVETAIR